MSMHTVKKTSKKIETKTMKLPKFNFLSKIFLLVAVIVVLLSVGRKWTIIHKGPRKPSDNTRKERRGPTFTLAVFIIVSCWPRLRDRTVEITQWDILLNPNDVASRRKMCRQTLSKPYSPPLHPPGEVVKKCHSCRVLGVEGNLLWDAKGSGCFLAVIGYVLLQCHVEFRKNVSGSLKKRRPVRQGCWQGLSN